MNYNLISFFEDFYGFDFLRIFTRPYTPRSGITFKKKYYIKGAKQLYLRVKNNNGFFPCFISLYEYSNLDKNSKKSESAMIDRIFLDFDAEIPKEISKTKRDLEFLRELGVKKNEKKQSELRRTLVNHIIKDKLAEEAINEAKNTAISFKEDFGRYPALFFSGFKGCHLYAFFNEVKLANTNKTILHFAENIKEAFNYKTLDLAVNRDSTSRLSRIPYSKHHLTGLTVVPFSINDSYETIINKSLNCDLNNGIEFFDKYDHYINLDNHLLEIDNILNHNQNILKQYQKPLGEYKRKYKNFKNLDHRSFFKEIIGTPTNEYTHYNMYNCPFKDHEDNKPSFMVYKKGYKCLGCGKEGNYFQFLKDYNNWTNKEVKDYLKDLNN